MASNRKIEATKRYREGEGPNLPAFNTIYEYEVETRHAAIFLALPSSFPYPPREVANRLIKFRFIDENAESHFCHALGSALFLFSISICNLPFAISYFRS